MHHALARDAAITEVALFAEVMNAESLSFSLLPVVSEPQFLNVNVDPTQRGTVAVATRNRTPTPGVPDVSKRYLRSNIPLLTTVKTGEQPYREEGPETLQTVPYMEKEGQFLCHIPNISVFSIAKMRIAKAASKKDCRAAQRLPLGLGAS
jgi:hypothetical protein